jgi:NADPH:quinone reductase and related Zn-dependent oxidoreductases
VALGLVGDKQEIGLEGSGIIRRVGSNVKGFSPGDRVVAFHPGLLQTRIVTTPDRCMKASDALSLEEAVTMPSAYATAMYSLIELGSLKKGQVRPARTTS